MAILPRVTRSHIGVFVSALLCTSALVATGSISSSQAATPTGVVINEVRCDDFRPDYIELYNASTTPIDLSDWVVGDHLGNLNDAYHVKRIGSIILGAKRYTKVLKGLKPANFLFNIACGDDTIKLATVANGTATLVDSVDVPPIAQGFAWGRLAAAQYGWGATIPTYGTANKAAPLGSSYDPSAWIFDPMISKRIDLTLPNATVTNFQNGNPGKVYQPATFVMTNPTASATPTPLQVGIRLKTGYGSYRPFGTLANPSKSSFKIKFDSTVAGQRYFGINKLTLNNMVQDPSLVHEWASYTLFRTMGIPAPRVGYASVYVNNIFWGFYLTLEPYADVSLSWNYPNTQHLYEALWTDRPPDLNTGRANIAYQIDEGSLTNRTDLATLITVLNNYPISSAQVTKYLNVDEVAKVMAIEQYLNHWDGYTSTQTWTPNNYYLHSDESGFFELLPWGTDQTFGGNAADFSAGIGILFNKCRVNDYCKSQYLKAIAQVSKVANSLNLPQTISSILTGQRDGITADTGRGMSFNDTLAAGAWVSTHLANATSSAATYLRNNAQGNIHWSPPSALTAETRLPASFFNAYSDVAGTFKYSVAVNKLLKVGTLKVIVTFTPTDLVNYSKRTLTFVIPVTR